MTKILLVEDDKSLREIYGVRLLAEGYDIVSAGDGEEALAMAIKERPQLIISDVMMPKISGFDMLDILRSTTETKDIRVIMMTALSSDDQRARGEQLGADRYLVKSQVGIEDVVRTVHEILADAPVAAAALPSPQQAFSPAPQPRPAVAPAPRPVATPAPAQQSLAQPIPQPAVSQQPVYQPQPQVIQQPQQAAPVASTPSQFIDPQTSTLPQPTAPFSTPRPATLGERVIHPLETPPQTGPNVSDMINQELSSPEPADLFAAPAPQTQEQPQASVTPELTVPPTPQPPTFPAQQPPQPQSQQPQNPISGPTHYTPGA